jgi:IS30 family transposase
VQSPTRGVPLTAHLNIEQRALARRLRAKKMSLRDIAKQIGCSSAGIDVMLRGQSREARPIEWVPRRGALSIEEREEILRGLSREDSLSAIARQLGRHTSSVSREVKANGGRVDYRIWPAHQRAQQCAKRPKTSKLSYAPLAKRVTEDLEKLWSPEEIALRLALEFPQEPRMQLSHETIYQSLYVQGRGELRRELARCLRYGHTSRQSQGRVKKTGPVANMINISERPPEVEDRAVPGHWEGDLIIGARGASAVGTLVERTTRFLLLLNLPNGHSAPEVEHAMRKAIKTLPSSLIKTITWDQGSELARNLEFTIATGVQVYFCDPHSPWQRGSNENTNGLLRQYMPKSTDLSKYSRADLRRIQDSLNDRPRKTLGFLKPVEKLSELVALTA